VGVKDGVEVGVVVHLELAIELEAACPGEDFGPEDGEAGGEVFALFEEEGEAVAVALVVIFGGVLAAGFFAGMEDFEGEDGEAVDHEAGSFGVERGGLGLGLEACEEGEVDAFGEVIAALVELVDTALAGRNGLVAGHGIAGIVFAVPEVEVGAMLFEDEALERGTGAGGRGVGVVPVDVGLIVEAGYVGGI
jgi:hypothetical protein